MIVRYEPIRVDIALQLLIENPKRTDLFFEDGNKYEALVLKNLSQYNCQFDEAVDKKWFQRKAEEVYEGVDIVV